jgi:curved DNA-binding protein CbpA
MTNPFTVLGLPTRPDLTDEQVRAAWRAIAAATHPDRPGGGNADRYAAASAAYAALRTPWARSEAHADLISQAPRAAPATARAGPRPPGARLARSVLLLPARIRHGRPVRLLTRLLVAALLALGRVS